MRYLYTKDPNDRNTVTVIADDRALVFRTGVKPYQRRGYANAYLKDLAYGRAKLPEPDEIVPLEDDENEDDLEERLVGCDEHIGFFDQIFPADPNEALRDPVIFHKCESLFACFAPPTDVWYRTKREAQRDADNAETVYLGEVEVFDPEIVKQIDDEIKSYRGRKG
jgi:hypothetical protein